MGRKNVQKVGVIGFFWKTFLNNESDFQEVNGVENVG